MPRIEVNDALTDAIKREVRKGESEDRESKKVTEAALERAERREWAHKKFGDERRWRE